jgi:serine/threonine protein kinase
LSAGVKAYGGGRYVASATTLAGGLSSVVVCKDINLDRDVAIKFLQPGTDKSRIYDEIAALQQVRSKHVVQVYDIIIVTPGNHVGIVQEFLPGNDLSVGFDEPTDTGDVLRAIYQLSTGVADIHVQGIIHRDIKPNNVKKDGEGLLKLFDFGLARSTPNASTTGFRGTPGFAAPELHTTGRVHFTEAIDAYALAATVLSGITGGLPPELFNAPPSPEAWKHRQGFSRQPVALPAEVAALLDACLSTDPMSRPAVGDLVSAVSAHLLFNKHRAILMSSGHTYVCDATRTTARVAASTLGALDVAYDGLRFVVRTAAGDVWINNRRVSVGDTLSGSCVITLGAPSLQNQRIFVTFDVSHPEVVL